MKMLDALAQDIDERPEALQPVDAALVDRIKSLDGSRQCICSDPSGARAGGAVQAPCQVSAGG